MFLVGEWAWELITCFLYVSKDVFCEIEEKMFQGVERPYELILWILRFEKSELDNVA
jgi:hypothetical protein